MATMAGKKKVTKKRATKKKAAMGRPSKFGTINRDQIRILAEKGFTDKEMAQFFGVTEQTWNNWKKAHPDFFEALKDWKLPADGKVERSLYERATGYSHPEEKIFQHNGEIVRTETIKHYPPDPTSMIFWLKNRQPENWRDKQEIEHTGLSDASDKEIRAALEAKLKALEAQGVDVGRLLGKVG